MGNLKHVTPGKPLERLTKAEVDLLKLVVEGLSKKEIAHNMIPYLRTAFWVLSSILLHGSIILFLAVFYSKQKDST